MPDIPKADITDYFESGKTKEDFSMLLKQEGKMLLETISHSVEALPKQLEKINACKNIVKGYEEETQFVECAGKEESPFMR